MQYAETVADKARELGLTVTHELGLNRYFRIGPTLNDLIAVPRLLRRGRFAVVHCHLSHDHAFAGLVARLPGTGRPRIVRSLYKRSVLESKPVNRFLLRRLTDGYVTFTDSFRNTYIERFGLDPDCVGVSPMTVDLQRFSPDVKVCNMREEFGIGPDAPVIGIVGRFQKYRRAEVFVQAAHLLLQSIPEARFLIIGRSSKIQETVVKPVADLGIGDAVILTGYRREDYVDTLAGIDIFSLLMPGFDGTARAVREALALGKPCVVSDYGMLPEIVRDGETGFVVPMAASELARAWQRIICDGDLQSKMRRLARKDAVDRFGIGGVGPMLADLYERALKKSVKE